MAETSSIEWTDATWNPITGCSVVSPGCTNCYAMRLAGGRLRNHDSRKGLTRDTKAGPVWTGEVKLNETWLEQPLQWTRARRIFVCAHGDLFAEQVPDFWIDQVFAVMAASQQHTFQVLTKRAARMRDYLSDPDRPRLIACAWCRVGRNLRDSHPGWMDRCWNANGKDATPKVWPLPNVWAGVSAEDQPRADERIPALLDTPAAVRFVSAEPLLGWIDFSRLPYGLGSYDALIGLDRADPDYSPTWWGCRGPRIDWVIVGGESGTSARPMHPAWVRDIQAACERAGVPFFFKQWGAWGPVDVFKLEPSAHRAYAGELLMLTGHESGPAAMAIPREYEPYPELLRPVGKKYTGRQLQGRTFDAMPGRPS